MSKALIYQSEGREIDWKVLKASLIIFNDLFSLSPPPPFPYVLSKEGWEVHQSPFIYGKLSELTSKECLQQL
jgi:hypothetical protein